MGCQLPRPTAGMGCPLEAYCHTTDDEKHSIDDEKHTIGDEKH